MARPHLEPFAPLRQRLHWAISLLVLVMIPTGLVMADTLDDALRLRLYQVHLLVGWTVVALSLLRVVLKARRPVAPPPGLPAWNLRLHAGVQWAVAVLPLLLALSGMGAMLQNDLTTLLQAGEAPPATLAVTQARDGHAVGAYAFTALLLIHVAGVVRYQTTKGNVLARMGVGRTRT